MDKKERDVNEGDLMLVRVSATRKVLCEFVKELSPFEDFEADGQRWPGSSLARLVFRRRDDGKLMLISDTAGARRAIETAPPPE
jgi:hypothetical protein